MISVPSTHKFLLHGIFDKFIVKCILQRWVIVILVYCMQRYILQEKYAIIYFLFLFFVYIVGIGFKLWLTIWRKLFFLFRKVAENAIEFSADILTKWFRSPNNNVPFVLLKLVGSRKKFQLWLMLEEWIQIICHFWVTKVWI